MICSGISKHTAAACTLARARDAAVKFKLRFEILKILTRALRTVQGKINYKFNPYAILLAYRRI